MYEITKEKSFAAAHKLNGHCDPITGGEGKCARLHGHNYIIRVCIRSPYLETNCEFVTDFSLVGKMLDDFCSRYDHRYINEEPPFASPYNSIQHLQTSAENIAKVLYDFARVYLESWIANEQASVDAHIYYAECIETTGTSTRYYNPEKVR